jgi:hypothetical protein
MEAALVTTDFYGPQPSTAVVKGPFQAGNVGLTASQSEPSTPKIN